MRMLRGNCSRGIPASQQSANDVNSWLERKGGGNIGSNHSRDIIVLLALAI